MGPWVDTYPVVGGTIKYASFGTAPNRRFVISFQNMPMYVCNNLLLTGQIRIFESSNIIETHIQNLPNCPSWNSGNAVMGLHDPSGTLAVPVLGMNNTSFTLSNWAVQYIPTCAMCNAPLPMAFSEIKAIKEESGNRIQWKTHFERQIENFELERSEDGEKFSLVCAQISKGNTSTGFIYECSDNQSKTSLTLYRVKANDFDGNSQYSETVAVYDEGSELAFIAAKWEKSNNTIHLTVENTQLERQLEFSVVDLLGRTLVTQKNTAISGRNQILIPCEKLDAATYFIKGTDGKGFQFTRKFVAMN